MPGSAASPPTAAFGAITAKTSDITETLYINGGLTKIDVGTLSGTLAAAGNIANANFRGDLAGAVVLAGTNPVPISRSAAVTTPSPRPPSPSSPSPARSPPRPSGPGLIRWTACTSTAAS